MTSNSLAVFPVNPASLFVLHPHSILSPCQ